MRIADVQLAHAELAIDRRLQLHATGGEGFVQRIQAFGADVA
ncbi:MAG TPA: hypothetical protein VGC19_08845 [Rhodanobacter sp.]